MSASILWNHMENFSRSSSETDYVASGWGFSSSYAYWTFGSPTIFGKTAIEIGNSYAAYNYSWRNLGHDYSPPSQGTGSFRFYQDTGHTGTVNFGLADFNFAQNVNITINCATLIMTISDSSGVKYTTPSPIFSFDIPYFIEFFATCSHAAGEIIVKVNGVQVGPTLTGLDTDINSTGSFQYMFWGASSLTYGTGFWLTDEGFIDTSVSGNPQFYGDNDVQTLFVTANNAVQFTPNGLANNYQNVSQVPPNSSDYNSSTTVGQQDTFIFGSLSALTLSVGGIFVCSNALNVSGGLHTYKQTWTGSSGSSFATYGTTRTLTNGYLMYGDSPTTNPATGAAWTIGDVNGMKAGYNLVS